MPKRIKRNAVYSPYCSICQYMKVHQDFRMAMLNSKYLNIDGTETIKQVMKRYGIEGKWSMPSMYNHFKLHQKKDIEAVNAARRQELLRDELEDRHIRKKMAKTPVFVRGVPADELGTDFIGHHELSLDAFIRAGRAKLDRNEMSITAATWLQAIKIKADIDKSQKDRKVDLFKSMFKGAAPGQIEEGNDGTGTEVTNGNTGQPEG